MKSLLKRIGPMILLATISGPASAQQAPTPFKQPPFTLPDDVSVRKATIWSEGTRLSASLYSPKGAVGKLPTIIMAYGWGGTMESVRIEGAKFAKAGYLVVMFDHRGRGESDGRVILSAPAPAERHGNRFTAEVVELREIRDPLADVEDLFNVVHWVQAEPQSDTSRIGIWGTSFGGGIAAYVAGFDRRIKAIHARWRRSNCVHLIGWVIATAPSGRAASSNIRSRAWSSCPACSVRRSPSTSFAIRLLKP